MSHRIFISNPILLFMPWITAKFHQNRIKIAATGMRSLQSEGQTDASDFTICPMV